MLTMVPTMLPTKMRMILTKMRIWINLNVVHQLSLSSDYVADPALLEPQYNFPRWNHLSSYFALGLLKEQLKL